MSVEIINARSDPSPGGPPSYYQKTTTYNRTAKTDAQQKAFFQGYIKVGTITGAARLAQIDPTYHYKWLETDPDYPAKFKVVHQTASEALLEEARRRAHQGVEEPTGWYQGQPGGFVRRYSDSLLKFLIEGAFPDIYKQRLEHSGKIEVQSTVAIESFPAWWKQATVVIGSGVQIDVEMERMLQEYFEAKFLEAEKLVGSGTTNQPEPEPTNQLHQPIGLDQSEPIIEMVAESAMAVEEPEPNRDWRPAKRVSLDMDDI